MYSIPTQPSAFSRNEGDPKKGGTGFRVKRPQQDNWREYGFEFTVVHPLDQPYFFIEHQLKLAGGWKSVYCLGTPPEFTNGQIQPDPLGVERCRQITIPGYNVPLHECANELPEGEARTRVLYRFIVINWSTEAIQLMDAPEMALQKMFETIQEDAAANGGKLDMLKFTWAWKCEPSGAMWKNVVEPVYYTRWRTRQDIQELWGKPGRQERYEKIHRAFSRAQTLDQILETLGGAKPGGATPPFASPVPAEPGPVTFDPGGAAAVPPTPVFSAEERAAGFGPFSAPPDGEGDLPFPALNTEVAAPVGAPL